MKYLLSLVIAASACLFATDLKVVEEIVAKCNGDIVTRSDLDKAHKELAESLPQRGSDRRALDKKWPSSRNTCCRIASTI